MLWQVPIWPSSHDPVAASMFKRLVHVIWNTGKLVIVLHVRIALISWSSPLLLYGIMMTLDNKDWLMVMLGVTCPTYNNSCQEDPQFHWRFWQSSPCFRNHYCHIFSQASIGTKKALGLALIHLSLLVILNVQYRFFAKILRHQELVNVQHSSLGLYNIGIYWKGKPTA